MALSGDGSRKIWNVVPMIISMAKSIIFLALEEVECAGQIRR